MTTQQLANMTAYSRALQFIDQNASIPSFADDWNASIHPFTDPNAFSQLSADLITSIQPYWHHRYTNASIQPSADAKS